MYEADSHVSCTFFRCQGDALPLLGGFRVSDTQTVLHRVQQLMLSNTAVKISALTAITLPAVLIGGEIYSAITGQPASLGFIKIYSVLLMIPGMH